MKKFFVVNIWITSVWYTNREFRSEVFVMYALCNTFKFGSEKKENSTSLKYFR